MLEIHILIRESQLLSGFNGHTGDINSNHTVLNPVIASAESNDV